MAAGGQEFIIFGVIGAVILDADILFTLISRNRPSLYMYIHGGAAHSILGSAVMAICAYFIFYIFSVFSGGVLHYPVPFHFGLPAAACTVGGAWLHVVLDYLATPGIPLFWPRSDEKYTVGVFAGPSFFMIVVSWTFLILLVLGRVSLSFLWIYGTLFLAFLFLRGAIRVIAFSRLPGDSFPTFNPLRWMVLRKEGASWSAGFFSLTGGSVGGIKNYPESTGVTADDLKKIETIPEVRRVRYNSYFTVTERNGEIITVKDPLREDGTIRYPPYYKHVRVRIDGSVIQDA